MRSDREHGASRIAVAKDEKRRRRGQERRGEKRRGDERRGEERRGEEEQTTDIKSNNRHPAGGKKSQSHRMIPGSCGRRYGAQTERTGVAACGG